MISVEIIGFNYLMEMANSKIYTKYLEDGAVVEPSRNGQISMVMVRLTSFAMIDMEIIGLKLAMVMEDSTMLEDIYPDGVEVIHLLQSMLISMVMERLILSVIILQVIIG